MSMKGETANTTAYTIIETAQATHLNLAKYFNYLFEQLPNLDFIRNPELMLDFLLWVKILLVIS